MRLHSYFCFEILVGLVVDVIEVGTHGVRDEGCRGIVFVLGFVSVSRCVFSWTDNGLFLYIEPLCVVATP